MEIIKKSNFSKLNFSYKDFIPAISGLIGKIALVSSFALMWAKELSITNPNFVLGNVRIEILIGSLITLIAAICYPNAAPAGTLAPLVVLIPIMAAFGVHPLILGILVGVIGFIVVKTGIYTKMIDLAGTTCRTSITLTFGVAGIWMSTGKLHSFFSSKRLIFWILIISLLIIYISLYFAKKSWLVIPVAAVIAFAIPKLLGMGYIHTPQHFKLHLNPFYWWNDMWGIGFGLNAITIMKTIPFAFFVILLWSIDTISIQTIQAAVYGEEKQMDKSLMDISQSYLIVSIRNFIGVIFGGAQTASLWRSFLIPLFMIKRPIKNAAILLGILGILSSLTVIPIQIMAYPPLVWSVLLFGIFMPFTVIAVSYIRIEKKVQTKLAIIIFALLGIVINPIVTWITAVIYEKLKQKLLPNR